MCTKALRCVQGEVASSLGSQEPWYLLMVASGVRNKEGFAKDGVGSFPMSAGEPLKVAEQGGRVVSTVLRQQCPGCPGGGRQSSWAQELLGMLSQCS